MEYEGRVFYQIFPDRFHQVGRCDLIDKLQPYWIHQDLSEPPVWRPNERGEVLNNDFYGGNLAGIREKLPYLHDLGVGALYLNPIFMACSSHRYDTADYSRIDPMLGTDQDFQDLCNAAHDLGMKIILDGVFSHTGSNSIYFDVNHIFGHGAVSDPHSPYRSWYLFRHYPNDYESWWGFKNAAAASTSTTPASSTISSAATRASSPSGSGWVPTACGWTWWMSCPTTSSWRCASAFGRSIPRRCSSARSGRTHPTRSPTACAAGISPRHSWTAS